MASRLGAAALFAAMLAAVGSGRAAAEPMRPCQLDFAVGCGS